MRSTCLAIDVSLLTITLLGYLLVSLVVPFAQAGDTTTTVTPWSVRGCQTICDCYKNSGHFDDSDAHLCYECSRTANNTCRVVAACASGFICSIDPSDESDTDLVCLEPNQQQPCLRDSDCTRSFAVANVRSMQAITTMTGFCMTSGKCRHQPYGVLQGDRALSQTLKPFDHSRCEQVVKHCSASEECYSLERRHDTVQTLAVLCDHDVSGTCQTSNSRAIQLSFTAIRDRFIAATSAPDTGGVEGRACASDQECIDFAQINDPRALTGCYACVKAAIPTAKASNPQWNTTSVCVKTEAACSSGMCLNGQCLGKACASHLDCFEVAGSSSHCHRCDHATKLCTAAKICPSGSYCVFDTARDHQCSPIVKPCEPPPLGNELANYEDAQYCIPLDAKRQFGYLRTSDIYHTNLLQQQQQGTSSSEDTRRRLSSTTNSAHLTLASDAKREAKIILEAGSTTDTTKRSYDDGNIDSILYSSNKVVTTEKLPERDLSKVIQRTPTKPQHTIRSGVSIQANSNQVTTAAGDDDDNTINGDSTPTTLASGDRTTQVTTTTTPTAPVATWLEVSASYLGLNITILILCVAVLVLFYVILVRMPATNAKGEIVHTYVKEPSSSSTQINESGRYAKFDDSERCTTGNNPKHRKIKFQVS